MHIVTAKNHPTTCVQYREANIEIMKQRGRTATFRSLAFVCRETNITMPVEEQVSCMYSQEWGGYEPLDQSTN